LGTIPTFKIGHTLATFRSFGTIPEEKETLIIRLSGSAMCVIANFRVSTDMLSYPELFVGCIELTTCKISAGVVRYKEKELL